MIDDRACYLFCILVCHSQDGSVVLLKKLETICHVVQKIVDLHLRSGNIAYLLLSVLQNGV